jgi:hypothetical protein
MEIPSMDNGIFMGARASTDGGSGEEGREDKVEGDEDRDASNGGDWSECGQRGGVPIIE